MRAQVASLVLSAAAFVGILGWEKFRPTTYSDVGGVPTIGFGETKGVKPGDTISVDNAVARALDSANEVGEAIKKCITVPVSQNEYDAFVSLAYNIGPGAFCNSTLVRLLNSGDYQGACAQILRWNRVNGTVVNGLVKRRQAEHDLCLKEGGARK